MDKFINIAEVNWRNDNITRRYITEHYAQLIHPGTMTAHELADAHTFCIDIENPYAKEICRRAALLEAFERMTGEKGKGIVLRAAAQMFGIILD